ncbi:MAG: Hsp20/alpha crystallin family protein [Sandaracinaceae bacterium]
MGGAFADLRRQMDQLFTDFDRDWMAPLHPRGLAARGLPAMELRDDGEALSVRMEVPGFAEKDVQVDLNRNTLTIRGARETVVPEGYSVHRRERGALSFARSISLPCAVEADGVEATLQDGVLSMRMPKAREAQPRTIEIRSVD